MKKLFPILAIANLAFSGLLCAYGATKFMGGSFNLITAFVCLGLIGGIYMLNRYSDLKEDFANSSDRAAFFSSNRYLFGVSIALLASSFLLMLFSYRLTIYPMLLLLIGVAYSVPSFPWPSKNRIVFIKLKQIPFIKNVMVSTLWGLSIFFIPLTMTDAQPSNIFIITLFILSHIIALCSNTLFLDICDYGGDSLAKIKTLPIAIGIPNSRLLIVVINGLYIGVVFILFSRGIITYQQLLFFITVATYPFIYVLMHMKTKFSRSALEIITDAGIAVYGIGMILISPVR